MYNISFNSLMTCADCAISFESITKLTYHFATVHREKEKNNDTIIPKESKTGVLLPIQTSIEHEETQTQTELTELNSKGNFARLNEESENSMLQNYSEPSSYRCNWISENDSECGKSLSSKSALQIHMRIHEDIRPFACSHCDQAFRQRAHLKRHVASVHGGKENPIDNENISMTIYLNSFIFS